MTAHEQRTADMALLFAVGVTGILAAAGHLIALILLTAVLTMTGWAAWLDWRYGNVVSPDQTITVGVALIAGWLLIITAAIVAVGVVTL